MGVILMKKTVCLILVLVISILALASCGNKYKPQSSTKEEASTVFVLNIGENEYEIKYELYRWLFLTHRDSVDGGDRSVWSGPDKNKYITKINTKILSYSTEIFAAFEMCERIGYNLYSNEVEDKIYEYIKISVEGGSVGGEYYPGIGSYDEYLALLKENYMNYAVQELLFRYAIAIDAINEHFIGTISQDDIDSGSISVGNITYTREDVEAFYFGEDSVRVLRHFIQDGIREDTAAYADLVRERILNASYLGHEEVVNTIMGNSNLASVTDVRNGYVIGRYNLEEVYYGEMTDYAFALSDGNVSPAFLVDDGETAGYYILYRAEKTEEHFESCYNSILYVFLKDRVGEKLHELKSELSEEIMMTQFYTELNHSNIAIG